MPSRQNLPQNHHSSTKVSALFLTIVIFASLVIFLSFIYFIYYLWYSLIHRSRTSPYDSPNLLVKLQKFSFQELKSATNGFSSSNSIGKGGSGTVYRGILKDGKLVAIKFLDSTSFQGDPEFQNELQILGGLKSPFLVLLLGYCVEKNKRLVVYEYLPNKSLQELLFSDSGLYLSWVKRYDIILDIARALEFLHLECDPPVIHGDVKPSNVLLDSEYRAKLSDFGLSRLKIEEGEFGVDLFSQDFGKSQDLWKSQELSGNLGAVSGETPQVGTPEECANEVDFALALQASCSSKNGMRVSNNVSGLISNSLSCNGMVPSDDDAKTKTVKGKEVMNFENGGDDSNRVLDYDYENCSVDLSKELNSDAAAVAEDNVVGKKQWGRDWWWKQEGAGELCSKDYVTEWIGSQICPSPNPDWEEEKKSCHEKTNLDSSKCLDKFEVEDMKESEQCSKTKIENGCSRDIKSCRSKKHKKMKEWWKEEHLDELKKKSKQAKKLENKSKKRNKMPHFDLSSCIHFCKRRKLLQQGQDESDPNMEFSFRKGFKKKKNHSMGSEMWSGEIFSRELSSTTSMRGTLCYVAPEYGGCGYLMEKADIYSFGVLILVIVSGRRPLHVLSSPMKLEKANLVSWCRHLAQVGNVCELVDEKLNDEYNKDEASLCINLALACLQRMPELRPDIGDVVKILRGEMELVSLPYQFSPSPPSKLYSRSRRKHKSNAE